MSKSYEQFHEQVADRIKKIRIAKGKTQEAMEEGSFAINARTYQRIENRETDISLKNLYLISKQLDVEITEFFKFD
jgi:transcriptional regulator with XRE-family HTH domain